MRILVIDDHAMLREGLSLLLTGIEPGLRVDGASSVAEAADADQDVRLVLLDLGLAATQGLDTLRHCRDAMPETPIVVLSGDDTPEMIRRAIEEGAAGFIPKTYGSTEMVAALRLVLAGGVFLPPQAIALRQPGDGGPIGIPGAYERLSARQREVAGLLLAGQSNKGIARRLDLSEGTVKAHLSSIFRIVGARNRVEAVLIAAREGVRSR